MRRSLYATLATATTLVALLGTSTAFAQVRLSTSAMKTMPAAGGSTMAGCILIIDGIPGESSDGSVAIQSFSWGMSNPTSIGNSGMSAGKVSMSDLSLTKRVDKSSPMLFTKAVGGAHFKTVTLSCRNSAGAEYYKVSLQDAMVTSLASQSSDGMPMESLSFNYTKIEYSYSPAKGDGSLDKPVIATYDLKANKK